MSRLLLAKNNLFSKEQALILTTACAVNIFIFYLILQMVTHEHKPLNKIDSVNFLDFIHSPKTPEVEERKIEEQQQQPPKEEEKLPPPDLPQPKIKKPLKTVMDFPTPDINIPLSINGLPYIGDFLKSTPPTSPIVSATPAIAKNLTPIRKISPSYPSRALRSGIEGIVSVEFTITVDGAVKDPIIIKSNPPKIFDRSVLKAIKRWEFNSQIIDGKTVERRARQDIQFTLQK